MVKVEWFLLLGFMAFLFLVDGKFHIEGKEDMPKYVRIYSTIGYPLRYDTTNGRFSDGYSYSGDDTEFLILTPSNFSELTEFEGYFTYQVHYVYPTWLRPVRDKRPVKCLRPDWAIGTVLLRCKRDSFSFQYFTMRVNSMKSEPTSTHCGVLREFGENDKQPCLIPKDDVWNGIIYQTIEEENIMYCQKLDLAQKKQQFARDCGFRSKVVYNPIEKRISFHRDMDRTLTFNFRRLLWAARQRITCPHRYRWELVPAGAKNGSEFMIAVETRPYLCINSHKKMQKGKIVSLNTKLGYCGSESVWKFDPPLEPMISPDDEEICRSLAPKNHKTYSSWFECRPGDVSCHDTDRQCVRSFYVCDGHPDCPPPTEGKDEQWISLDEDVEMCLKPRIRVCLPDKNDCQGPTGRCVRRHHQWRCQCDPGFSLINESRCEDIDECENEPDMCGQLCVNEPGSYRCACHPGRNLSLYIDGRACREISEIPALLISFESSMNILDLKSGRYSEMFKLGNDQDGHRDFVSSFDYALKTRKLYWSDGNKRSILSCKAMTSPGTLRVAVGDNRSCSDPQLVRNSTDSDGLAVDWIHDLLYWTDHTRDEIAVMVLSSERAHHKVLVSKDLDVPTDIVVDPESGLIFWIDAGRWPKIERASLSGKERIIVVSNESLHWPRTLALDFENHIIYWGDGGRGKIRFVSYDGTYRNHVPLTRTVNPFAVTLFEDAFFFSDVTNCFDIIYFNKSTGQELYILKNDVRIPKAVKVWHKSVQPEFPNICENHRCDHLCLPNSQPKIFDPSAMNRSDSLPFECHCSSGYELDNDQISCKRSNQTVASETTKKPTRKDSESEFGACSQICKTQQDSYLCKCHKGYHLQSDGSCKANYSYFIYASVGNSLRIFDSKQYRGTFYPLQKIKSLPNQFALDYISYLTATSIFLSGPGWLRNCYQYFPLALCNIILERGSPNTSDIFADGIAADWVHHLIFWTDSNLRIIAVFQVIKGRFIVTNYKILFSEMLDKPKGIAVDPEAGLIFWTDCGKEPRIERASLNAQARLVIVKDNIVTPNDLALDLLSKRIYWVDSELAKICTVSYDGSDLRVILASSARLRHPFSIDVFEDSVFWSDWESQSILSANKFTGKGMKILFQLRQKPGTIRVFHKLMQPSFPNLCENNTCPQLCLPKSQPWVYDSSAVNTEITNDPKYRPYECHCEDGFELNEYNGECEKSTVPESKNATAVELTTAEETRPNGTTVESITSETTVPKSPAEEPTNTDTTWPTSTTVVPATGETTVPKGTTMETTTPETTEPETTGVEPTTAEMTEPKNTTVDSIP